MFVLVNMTNEPKTVTLDGVTGTWHHFRHNETITTNTFNLKPLEVIVGTSQVKDADLPTYQETDALINKMEYDRTHTGNLLFERRKDIAITTSGSLGYARKLFDGVRDNYGWGMIGDGGDSFRLLEQDTFTIENIPENIDGWKMMVYYDTGYGWTEALSENIMG